VKARLVARELAGGYPGVTVFSGASFSVESGEILTVLGANGSGKSALLETLQGLLAHRGGAVLLDGESVQDLAPEVRAARGMSLLSDRRRLFRDMTVDEHLRVGAYRAAARRGWRRRALDLRGIFAGLTRHRGSRPAGLSGGLQQQLALARFGMSSPRVWLLDDPLQGLDEETTGRVLDWIQTAARAGAAVMLTGQHVRALLGVATKAMFLEGGSLSPIPVGTGGLSDPRVRQLL
jgi:branched-chain amino acid transport system ATP-binding protein